MLLVCACQQISRAAGLRCFDAIFHVLPVMLNTGSITVRTVNLDEVAFIS